jgi:hypothetical protein
MTRPLALLALLAALPAAAEDLGITLDEFKMYQHYKNAMEDPRVQKMKPAAQLPAIAKDARYKPKQLEAAVAKGEAAGDLKAKCEAALTAALEAGELTGKLGKVEADTSDPHAVAYVQWSNENPANLEEEASFAAATSVAACPIISTVQVWAQDKANAKTRVFQALISNSAAQKIKLEKVKDFADTRYIRLFEKVKNVANGDDLSADTGRPSAKSDK